MKVAYFSNQFSEARGHGISRYSRQLFHALNDYHSDLDVTPVSTWSNREKQALGELKSATGLKILPWGRRLTPFAWVYFERPFIESWIGNVDVVHAVSLGFPIATRKPYVVTVHDIGPLTHPEYFSQSPAWIMEKALEHALKKAVAFICVSKSTAEELTRFVQEKYGYDISDRIHVVYEAVDSYFFQRADESCLVGLSVPEKPIILTAGALSPRKNIQSLISAFSQIKDGIPHHLIAVGGEGWDVADISELIKRHGVVDRIHLLPYVSDQQLHALYQRATVYVHPSLYEGFGLTVLEAMAAGCPVITSDVYSLPEIAGGAALLVNPKSIESIAAALESVCKNRTVQHELVHSGRIRAKNFSWRKCSEEVAQVYRAFGLNG